MEKSKSYLKKFSYFQEGTMLVTFLVLTVLIAVFVDGFITQDNLTNLVRQTSINGILALGMTIVMISGGIDLSVGAIVGLTGMLVAIFTTQMHMGLFVSIVLSLLAGLMVGFINGVIIHNGRVPAFIATLGIQIALRGFIMLISNATMISNLPPSFISFSQASVLGMPSLFICWVLIIILIAFILSKSTFGRNLYAIGSNEEAARLSGISIRKNRYLTYAVSALMAGFAGILLASRMASGIPTAGTNYELNAIAAAVIGGTSMNGAEGSVLGTIIGTFFMALLSNAGNLLGINSFILDMLTGTLIIIAVFLDMYKKK